MLPNQFGVNWLLGLGVEAKNRFSRWLLFTLHDARRMAHDRRQTLTDHNSSPCALHAQVS